MRILLVTHHYFPEVGAPQFRWDALVERFVAHGHEVAVLAPSPHFPSGKAGPLPPSRVPGAIERGSRGEMIHRLHFREYDGGVRGRGLDQAISAADAIRIGSTRFRGRHRPDIVVATAPALPSIPAGLVLGASLRVPVVLEMRDAWPDLLRTRDEWDPQPRHRPLDARLLDSLGSAVPGTITAMQRRADAVVTTTQAFADILRERGMRRVRVIRNGAHMVRHPQLPHVDRAGGELRILYLGTVGRAQGLANAVHAAAMAQASGVPVRLRIIGEGAEAVSLARLVKDLDAPVEMRGPVPPGAVMQQYLWADTVLVSLRPWEPLRWTVPSKMYEVLGTGRHISGVLDGEAAEILRTSGGGHAVPPGDPAALAELWATLHTRRQLLDVGTSGREWVTRHASDDTLAASYLTLLDEVVHA